MSFSPRINHPLPQPDVRFAAVVREQFNGNPFDPQYHQGDCFFLDVDTVAMPRYVYRVTGQERDQLVAARRMLVASPLTESPTSNGYAAIKNFFALLKTLTAKAIT